MAAQAPLENARSKKVVQMHLLGHPFEVHQHDYEKRYMDSSPEHRAEMRSKLYGQRKGHDAMPNTSAHESGNYRANYADEQPPEWRSTTKSEYVVKPSDRPNMKALYQEYATFTRNSHFSLDGYGEPEKPISLTKKDYCGKDPKLAPRSDYREFLKTYHMYPPIFRDEAEMTMSRDKEFVVKKPSTMLPPRFQRKPMVDQSAVRKNTTHFSLGDDPMIWESVTKSAMHPHKLMPKPPPSEYERLEKKRSTVLDNPDLELDPMKSVQQLDYRLSSDLDRSTLTVDNTNSIKDLKSTHFSLGTEEQSGQKSQYQATFAPPPSHIVGAVSRAEHKAILAQPASKFCIIAEDFEDRRIGRTSHGDDFKNPRHVPMKYRGIVFDGNEIKKVNSQSSIPLGLNNSNGLSNASRSVTKSDYGRPIDKRDSADAAREAYERGGKTIFPEAYIHDPFNVEGGTMHGRSVTSTDFVGPDPTKIQRNPDEEEHKIYLKSSHFDIGTDEDPTINEDRKRSTTKSHYVQPQDMKHYVRKDAAGADMRNGSHSVSRKHDRFQATLENTVSRYPNEPNTFVTVTGSTYTKFKTPIEHAEPFIPSTTTAISTYLHPCVLAIPATDGSGVDGITHVPIREFSTVSRRTYIAPEVMRFK